MTAPRRDILLGAVAELAVGALLYVLARGSWIWLGCYGLALGLIMAVLWFAFGERFRIYHLRALGDSAELLAGPGPHRCVLDWMRGCELAGPRETVTARILQAGHDATGQQPRPATDPLIFPPLPLGGGNDPFITVECNQAAECFSIRQLNQRYGKAEDDLIHFCDWPSMRSSIDAYQRARLGLRPITEGS